MRQENNYELLDIHEENVGMRNNDFVLFDQKNINISYDDSIEHTRLIQNRIKSENNRKNKKITIQELAEKSNHNIPTKKLKR